MTPGPAELLIILAIVVLIFGGARVPKLARSFGQARNELRAGLAEGAGAEREASAIK